MQFYSLSQLHVHAHNTQSHTSQHTYARSNTPNENKMDALRETVGGVINCCLSPPTDNDGLYPAEFAGNRFYLDGLFIVFLIGGVVRLE